MWISWQHPCLKSNDSRLFYHTVMAHRLPRMKTLTATVVSAMNRYIPHFETITHNLLSRNTEVLTKYSVVL